MIYRLQFRRYTLPFRFPVRTAHGGWMNREGLIVRLESEAGSIGFGEAAPIPDFGEETAAADEAALRALGDRIAAAQIAALPAELGCLRHALAAAAAAHEASGAAEQPASGSYLPMAALLPAGRAAVAAVAAKADAGFRVFKWKVGVAGADEEIGLLDEVCAVLPAGGKLRLDANGAWDRRQAERWLARCAECPVEWVEQPVFARAADGAGGRKRTEDLLLGLARNSPTPLALDESIANDVDLEHWLEAGWPGIFVIKSSLHGNVHDACARLAKARADVIFSSALETAIGARSALATAFAWHRATDKKTTDKKAGATESKRALGFGVWPLFADSRFDGPAAMPFLRWQDVEKLDAEAVWNALS